jgi:hypothetical protein
MLYNMQNGSLEFCMMRVYTYNQRRLSMPRIEIDLNPVLI